MEAYDEKEFARRLILARMRIMNKNGFYGLLLMHAHFALDLSLPTAATDGEKIFFSPEFMRQLSDSELDFVLMHEIMHIALKHCFRDEGRDPELFNIACDIVVNSNILQSCGMNIKSITLKNHGEAMHVAPDGQEGYLYTAEQVYKMLEVNRKPREPRYKGGNIDSHDKWGKGDPRVAAEWEKCVADAAAAETNRRRAGENVPAGVERLLKELRRPTVDWRTVLVDFIQEEVCDYSFSPCDRRYDTDFFLPDFNDKCDKVKNILFMIDTSASMSEDMLTAVYSEVYGAVEQFDGNIEGKLGFFDAEVIEPIPFAGMDEFKLIKAKGGGGTSFKAIFDYINKKLSDDLPDSIIILTDGYADFPAEKAALGIPVLWVIVPVYYHEGLQKRVPPWGKTVYIP